MVVHWVSYLMLIPQSAQCITIGSQEVEQDKIEEEQTSPRLHHDPSVHEGSQVKIVVNQPDICKVVLSALSTLPAATEVSTPPPTPAPRAALYIGLKYRKLS